MLRQISMCLVCLVGVAFADGPNARNAGTERAGNGHLVIVGGGPAIEEIYRRTLELAGGAAARVLIVPFASPDPMAGAKSAEAWQAIGAMNVSVLDLTDAATALAAIGTSDLIWIRGGEQARLMSKLEETPGIADAIRARYAAGATIGGTSAGAAVMSQQMITGPAGRRGTPEARLARLGVGLGLWPDAIVDQHFVRRRRFVRLEHAIHANPTLLGVGIDEATAIIVSGREFEVMGVGPVIIYQSHKAYVDPPYAGVAPGYAVARCLGIRSHTLTAGMRYHLDQGLLVETNTTK